MDTLKKIYDRKQRIRSFEIKTNPNLIFEALDTNELQQMARMLNSINDVIKPYKLPELRKGLADATDDLTASIGSRGLKAFWNKFRSASTGGEIKANPSKLAKVASFETGLIKGLKQLPTIWDIVIKLEPKQEPIEPELQEADDDGARPHKPATEPKKIKSIYDRPPRAQGDEPSSSDPEGRAQTASTKPAIEIHKQGDVPNPNDPKGHADTRPMPPADYTRPDEPADESIPFEKAATNEPSKGVGRALGEKARPRIKGMMLNAFSPPGFLAMFRGMPYVDDEKVVDELLELDKADFSALVDSVKATPLVFAAERGDAEEIADRLKSAPKGQAPEPMIIEPESQTPREPEKTEQPTASKVIDIQKFAKVLQGTSRSRAGVESIVDWLINQGVEFNNSTLPKKKKE